MTTETILSEAQTAYIRALAEDLPNRQRATFFAAVNARTGGRPSDLVLQRIATIVFRELKRGELLAARRA
jgi:hypothetical protein